MKTGLRTTILIDNEAHASPLPVSGVGAASSPPREACASTPPGIPPSPHLATEHGLSIWIDTGTVRLLFDTGASAAFLDNARAVGIDPATADHVVLSHGHDDHTGGLAALDRVLPPDTPIHAHPGIFAKRYSRHADGSVHSIGLSDASREVLARRVHAFHPVTEPLEIAPKVWLTGEVPRLDPLEDVGGDFWLDDGCTHRDEIADDLSLWVEGAEGVWVFLGCAHAGVMNVIRHIRQVSGREDIHAVIGGMHLRHAGAERLKRTAAFFRALDPAILLPCHCSGHRIGTTI